MKLKKLSLADKKTIERYLCRAPHELSVYSFPNIYIWKSLFNISWSVVEDNLCVFFQDKMGCFLYLPPLGKNLSAKCLDDLFLAMDRINRNPQISRVENLEEKDLPAYLELGCRVYQKSCDYLCRRTDLVSLSGNSFKSKRASINYFEKHYDFRFRPYKESDRNPCLDLYKLWMGQRRKNPDNIYRGMLEDGLKSLRVFLRSYSQIDCSGRIIEIDGEIKAFTFGYKLNRQTFCVLYEITDLEVKGAAQFIFQKFCSELKPFSFINIMDDSGLENLKRVKLSYRPLKLIPAYIAARVV